MTAIRIRQYTFTITDRFAAGHPLTESEAAALNGLRAENIRNNTSKAVLDAIAALPDGVMLSAEAQASLQVRIAAYASSYEFVQKHQSKGSPDPIEVEVKKLAEAEVEEIESRSGTKYKDGFREAKISELALSDRIQAQARDRVGKRLALASVALAELI